MVALPSGAATQRRPRFSPNLRSGPGTQIEYYTRQDGQGTVEAHFQYLFDPMRRRIAKVDQQNGEGEWYAYREEDVVADCVSTGQSAFTLVSVYVQAFGVDAKMMRLDAGGDGTGFLYDSLGTQVAVAGLSGTLAESQSLGAWGERLIASPSPVADRYSGIAQREVSPESRMQFNRARSIDPSIARFIQRESNVEWVSEDHYRYADNLPLMRTDPSGDQPEDPELMRLTEELVRLTPSEPTYFSQDFLRTWSLMHLRLYFNGLRNSSLFWFLGLDTLEESLRLALTNQVSSFYVDPMLRVGGAPALGKYTPALNSMGFDRPVPEPSTVVHEAHHAMIDRFAAVDIAYMSPSEYEYYRQYAAEVIGLIDPIGWPVMESALSFEEHAREYSLAADPESRNRARSELRFWWDRLRGTVQEHLAEGTRITPDEYTNTAEELEFMRNWTGLRTDRLGMGYLARHYRLLPSAQVDWPEIVNVAWSRH